MVLVRVLLTLATGNFQCLSLPLVTATRSTSDFIAVTLDGEEGPYHTGSHTPRSRGACPADVSTNSIVIATSGKTPRFKGMLHEASMRHVVKDTTAPPQMQTTIVNHAVLSDNTACQPPPTAAVLRDNTEQKVHRV